MAFWHSSPLLSDSITGKAKLWPPSAYQNTYRVPQHSSEHFDARQCSVTRGAGQSGWSPDDLSPTFGFFLLRLLLHGTGGIITFLVLTFSAPILPDLFFSPHIFVQTSAADFYIGRIIPFFCHSSDCIGKYLAKSSLTSMLFNRRTKFKRSCSHHISSNTDGLCIPFTCFTLHNTHNLQEHLVYDIIGK